MGKRILDHAAAGGLDVMYVEAVDNDILHKSDVPSGAVERDLDGVIGGDFWGDLNPNLGEVVGGYRFNVLMSRGVVVWGDKEGEALVGGGVVIGAKDVEEEEGLEGGEGYGVGFAAELPELEGAVDHGTAGVVEEVEGVLGELERLVADGGVLIDDDGSLVAIVDGSK
ncbi:hypothetical protein MRB53_013436 [Persea americana]|uniref:Uncharacterized protein n=1 Tax=Persea americana TaxID=3435 RepID=A0ACC2K814_PERAE|nr:hypothetical protein MRB53_013436 [Persea americana]